jgi:hypothetical protein
MSAHLTETLLLLENFLFLKMEWQELARSLIFTQKLKKITNIYTRYQVLIVATMKVTLFWGDSRHL